MAFDFYFAGSQDLEMLTRKNKLGANELRSYITEKREIEKMIETKRAKEWSGKLMVDSGAFTIHRKGGEVDIDTYIDWLNEREDAIDYAIQLDKIPGVWGTPRTIAELKDAPVKTWENYLYMVERLKRPQMLLPVFHQYEQFRFLKQIVEYEIEGEKIPYICISGDKEQTNSTREIWYTKCFSIIHETSNPNVKVHCLGSATFSNADRFPFTSMDATTWIMAGANGNIITPWGAVVVSDRKEFEKDNLKNLPAHFQDQIKELCKKYEVDYTMLPSSYKERLMFNCHYIYEKSQQTTHEPKKFTTKSLF